MRCMGALGADGGRLGWVVCSHPDDNSVAMQSFDFHAPQQGLQSSVPGGS